MATLTRTALILALTTNVPNAAAIGAAQTGSCGDLESSVAFLMEQVARSNLTFIRNGTPHEGSEAAEHMLKKYHHFQRKIRRPEDFIRLAGTRSLLSGKPYQVVTADGMKVPTADWLQARLDACRAAPALPRATPGEAPANSP